MQRMKRRRRRGRRRSQMRRRKIKQRELREKKENSITKNIVAKKGFLDLSLHLYKRVCPSVGTSVVLSVSPSIYKIKNLKRTQGKNLNQ